MSFWDFVPALITAGATIYGTKQASKTNDKAAQQATATTQQATDVQLKALEEAKRNLEINRAAASPGLLATQGIISRGSALTPEQEQAVADSRDQALNALKGSSLRGSARATSAIVSDTDRRVRNNFMTSNQGRSDAAALGLAGNYFGSGKDIADNAVAGGGAASQGLINAGQIQFDNATGNASRAGTAIGDIGAIVADAAKTKIKEERDSSYKPIGQVNWNDGTTGWYN